MAQREIETNEHAKQSLVTDPYSPGKFRANISLSNIVEFYNVFGVKEDDGVYRSKKDCAEI